MTTVKPKAPRTKPVDACDVVMKGGITSGVVYPRALRLLGTHYRFKGIGGASAGALGAALGAAAELGRGDGGFDILDGLPDELVDGKLAKLFQPQHQTRKVLDLMLVATGSDRSGPKRHGAAAFLAIVWRAIRSFPIAGLLGIAPGLLCVIVGVIGGDGAGVVLIIAGLILVLVGWTVAVVWRVYRLFTIDIPANRFGICSGLSTKDGEPGLTDWLSAKIDAIAGLSSAAAPLTFGHLWAGKDGSGDASNRDIDLRLITTCLTEGTPFEMPFEARRFFFDPEEWRQLFPEYVVAALEQAPDAEPQPSDSATDQAAEPSDPEADDDGSAKKTEWQWETEQAAVKKLRRLPDAEHLPVIVATRMSLSFPLLIAAVPLYTINRRDTTNENAISKFRNGDTSAKVYFSQRVVHRWRFLQQLSGVLVRRSPSVAAHVCDQPRLFLKGGRARSDGSDQEHRVGQEQSIRHPPPSYRTAHEGARCGHRVRQCGDRYGTKLAGQLSSRPSRVPRPNRSCVADQVGGRHEPADEHQHDQRTRRAG